VELSNSFFKKDQKENQINKISVNNYTVLNKKEIADLFNNFYVLLLPIVFHCAKILFFIIAFHILNTLNHLLSLFIFKKVNPPLCLLLYYQKNV